MNQPGSMPHCTMTHGTTAPSPVQDPMPPNAYLLRCLALPGPSRQLARAAVALLGEAIADRELLYNIDLALAEACANVVRHAYPKGPPGNVEIVLSLYPGSHVDVEVADWGVGFPTWPVVVENAKPEAEGGRGLFIMSRLASYFECRKGAKRNSVFLRMQVAPELWNPLGAEPGAEIPAAHPTRDNSTQANSTQADSTQDDSAQEAPWIE